MFSESSIAIRTGSVGGEADAPRGVEPVREGHRFDEGSLAQYLRRQGLAFDALRVRQFEGGQSNPTYLLDLDERRFVLRKKPPGTLLPSAHQIEREYRVQLALRGTTVPVARQILLCEDAGVIGTAFYLMDYVEGRIYQRIHEIGDPQRVALLWANVIETLSAIHAVDWRSAGLADFGRGDGYLVRQLDRWGRQYRASIVGAAHPAVAPLIAWLAENLPRQTTTTLVHGDYRCGNLIAGPDLRIAAVLDWELATLGDPLADLAYLCMPYHLPPDLPGVMGLLGLDLARLGMPDERSTVAAYCRRSGRDHVPDWAFYRAFSLFRLAAIAQGVFARAMQGNASSPTAVQFERLASLYMSAAWSLAQGNEDEA